MASQIVLDHDHPSHEHPLRICDKPAKVRCKCCNVQMIDELYYGCVECKFYLHKSCGDSPEQIERHPFHPVHPLTLSLKYTNPGERPSCKVCGNIIWGYFSYRCNFDECKFNMDVQCASLTPNMKYEGHDHLLTLVENIKDMRCEACSFPCDGFCVRCVECNINYHVQCGEDRLTTTFVYENHAHPLTLGNHLEKDVYQFGCDSCDKKLKPKCPFYFCEQCNQHFHIGCMVSKIQVEERIKEITSRHEHFLFPYSKDNDVCCDACKKSILGPSFGCSKCEFFLHEDCFELMRNEEKRHPLHLQHPLICSSKETRSKRNFTCNACQNHCLGGPAYHCYNCKFDLDDECALLEPSIKYKGHKHLLTFFKKIFGDPKCEVCKLTYPNASYLRCVDCNFNVHFLCVPLPCTIKHECHIHPLTLNDCFVEDDSDEYYCDACETERDPWKCVYHCAGCSDYVAHVSCVIDEVLLSLTKEHEDVTFRTVDRQIANIVLKKNVTLLKDVIYSSNKDEEEELKHVQATLDNWFKKTKSGGEYRNSNNILEENLDRYSDNAFILFLERLESSVKENESTMTFWDLESKVVKVGGYMVSWNCASIIDIFFKIHEDIISADSKLSQRTKTHFLNMLGGVSHSMYNTKVKDITENLLINWWKNLKLVQHAGFEIQFVLDHLNRLAQARFDVEHELQEDTTLHGSQDKIEKLTNKLEKLKSQQKSYIISKSKRPESYKDVLIKTLELRLKTAGMCLCDSKDNQFPSYKQDSSQEHDKLEDDVESTTQVQSLGEGINN